jgi:hypothetical protein
MLSFVYGDAMQPVQICKLVSMTVNVVLLFNEHQRYFFFAQTIPRCLVAHFCKMLAHEVASLFASQRVAFADQYGDMKRYGLCAHFFLQKIRIS